MASRPTVFVSYCHRDRVWLERLQVHLKPLGTRGDLVLWDDTRIDPGEKWRSAISEAIGRSAGSILLISADFLASDFVVSEELPSLLHRAERDGARIIPIVVQPCRLANHPELAAFQTLNAPDRPLSKLTHAEAEEVFVRAAEEVERVLQVTDHVRSSPGPVPEEPSALLLRELSLSTMALSVLTALVERADGESALSLTELTRAVQASSRKLTYAAAERLTTAGWIDKRKESGRSVYRVTDEGITRLETLATLAAGPVRSVARKH